MAYLRHGWIISSLVLSTLLPFLLGKFLVARRSVGAAANPRDTNHQTSSLLDDTHPSSPSSLPSRCCTSGQLLLSVTQQEGYHVETLQDLKNITAALSDELGLNLLSLQCSATSAANPLTQSQQPPQWNLVRCIGLQRGRGYLAASKWVPQLKQQQQRQDIHRPLLLDFYFDVPSSSSSGATGAGTNAAHVQDAIDCVSLYFSASHVAWHQPERGFRYILQDDDDSDDGSDDKNNGNNPTLELDNPWVVDLHKVLMKQNVVYKRHVAHLKTAFQDIDIYDTFDIQHDVVETATGIPNKQQQQSLISPDRLVYFDSIMQSRKRGLEAYHEALVHPLLLAHARPRRVAIFGGGEGGTLREVLKHNTVQECVMIEIDEEIVEASRDVLKEWNDCSDILCLGDDCADSWDFEEDNDDGYRSCYDDPRATIYYEDAVSWFVDRYYGKDHIDDVDKFDVIILDSLDPGSMLEFSDFMYGNVNFALALRAALGEGGIVGGQVGIEKQKHIDDDHDWIRMIRNLEQAGFYALKDYMEGGCGFDDPWKFFVATTDARGLSQWYASEGRVNLELGRRAMHTRQPPAGWSRSPFHYIDGASMENYHAPSRKVEQTFCKFVGEHNDDMCFRALDPDRESFSAFALNVKRTGTGVARAAIDIPANAYLAPEASANNVLVMPQTVGLMKSMMNRQLTSPFVQRLLSGHGMWVNHFGEAALVVDHLALASVCQKGASSASNSSITPRRKTPMPFYNPSLHRHQWTHSTQRISTDSVSAGEELVFDEDNLCHSNGTARERRKPPHAGQEPKYDQAATNGGRQDEL